MSIDPAQALAAIKFNEDGLVPAIAQQHDSGEVLMMAWMNEEAVAGNIANRARLLNGRARARHCGARVRVRVRCRR